MAVSLLLAAGVCDCRRVKQAPASFDAAGEPAISGAGASTRAAVAAWATWPMPNSAPGLPNPQSFDAQDPNVVVDRVTGLMWQRNVDDRPATLAEAKQHCESSSLAGYDDWRLPSRIELVSILDLTRVQPAINVTAFPGTPSDWFWTASPSAENAEAAWYVYFYFGYPKTDLASNQFSVRCVRTNTLGPTLATRYEVQSDTVRDLGTGLVWQRAVPLESFTFEGARAYCQELSLGAQQGFRVPSLVELLTLIDEHVALGPMIDASAFPNTPSEAFWSCSDFGGTAGLAWQLYFDHGNALYGLPSAPFRVRCVR